MAGTESNHTPNTSASCLAHLAAALLGDDARSERRDAGAKVLFSLASLAGRAQQQSPAALAAAAEEALVAADVARDGATETLRHAICLALASSSGSAASRMAGAPPALPPAAPVLSARSSSSASGACHRSGGGGSGGNGDGSDGEGGNLEGPVTGLGRGVGSGGGRAVQDWVLQTLAPLLQHPSGRETRKKTVNSAALKRSGDVPIVLPETRRKLSAAELKKSPAEVRATELSAALGVADALLLQASAAGGTPPADESGRGGQDGKGPRPLLARLLLETPLAAGLLALARSDCARVRAEQDENPEDSHGTAFQSRTPSSRRRRHHQDQEQRNTNGGGGGGGDAEGFAPRAAADTADERAVVAATAEAALGIAREAAALCPEGLWVGLRAELLPALAAAGSGSGSSSGGVGWSVARVDGGVGEGGGGGVAGRVRAGLVLKEVVGGMGTGVVPFAARLLPVALRGMTDANEQVRYA